MRAISAVILLAGLCLIVARPAAAAKADAIREAEDTVATFKAADPGLDRWFDRCAGYAVFPTVGKGAIGVGGAHGKGVLFDRGGNALGKTSLTQVTVGLQLGGQAYSEIIFLATPSALDEFKSGNFALSAQASAVALTAGASANAKYNRGVAVFTAAKGGLMYEASIGGQKFKFEPF